MNTNRVLVSAVLMGSLCLLATLSFAEAWKNYGDRSGQSTGPGGGLSTGPGGGLSTGPGGGLSTETELY